MQDSCRTASHDAFVVLAVKVQLLVQNEVLQTRRENARVHDFRIVQSLQGQTLPDLQSAEVSEGARTACKVRDIVLPR